MNFIGYLNGTKRPGQGGNFGYPWCFSAWGVEDLPDNGNLTVGSQYAIDASDASNNENKTDQYCAAQLPARLVFQAHMAPLDIKFNNSGTEAWITFHGSWDRTDPVGYKLSVVAFNSNGEPVDSLQSKTAATDIFSNQDNSRCPDNCFRPVGMAIDPQGRIYVSSDASGEVYLITKTTGKAVSSPQPSSTTPMPSASSMPAASNNVAGSRQPLSRIALLGLLATALIL
jgi:glucose/arabinose dehydrogenase